MRRPVLGIGGVLIIMVFGFATLSQAATYYISKSVGSDSYTSTQAQSKSTPWAHLPGMVSCSSNCASYTPVAGDNFILKGGDTWTASDLGILWKSSGTASAPIYIGVDQTWYSGNSWSRPIFSCGGAACSGTDSWQQNYFSIVASYVTIDNIEFTGLYAGGTGPSYVDTEHDHDVVEHCYFHGWTIIPGTIQDGVPLTTFDNNNFSPYSSVGSGLFYSVIDGSDTARNSMHAIAGAPNYIVGNVIQYVTNATDYITTSIVHDNYWGPVEISFQTILLPAQAAHQNVVSIAAGDNGATRQFFYNNVITGTVCPTCDSIIKLWLDQAGTPSTVGYAFNNVIYNNTPGNFINQGHGNAGVNVGTWYFFNNTVECGTDSDLGACYSDAESEAGSQATFYSENNHWISNVNSAVSCINYTCSSTNDLLEGLSTANGLGYTSAETFAFSPTSSSGPTVGAGQNVQSLCTTIAALNADAGTACQSSTGYACTYNTTNHTVSCPNEAENLRPISGAWDIGAYQYSSKPSVLYGDVNGDGHVNAYDAALTAMYAVGLSMPSGVTFNPAAALVDGKSTVPTVYDAGLIAQYAVGARTCFPAQQGCTQ